MKIALIGYGKMGRMIEEAALKRDHQITFVVDPIAPYSEAVSGAVIFRTLPLDAEKAGNPDLFIEFTQPQIAPDNIKAVAALGKPIVCGTTGWHEKLPELSAVVEKAGTALLWSSNFSLGVNLFYRIAGYAAALFDPFAEYDVGGVEVHHRNKADSHSGTAKTLMEKVLPGMKRKKKVIWDLPKDEVLSDDAIHFASQRHGTVPGTHSLFFDSAADTIEITHTARSREGFALGAVIAAEWLGFGIKKNRQGIFTMDDVLKDLLP